MTRPRCAVAVAMVCVLSCMPAPAAQDVVSGGERNAVDDCFAAARAAAFEAVANGVPRPTARRQLEIAALRCQQPEMPPETAHFLGTVNSDLARFASAFLGATMPASDYWAAITDRRRKLDLHRVDRAFQRSLLEGDADGDLVPDRSDRCPGTPDGTPTDDAGCPQTPPRVKHERRDDQRLRREIGRASIIINPACETAPMPQRSNPIAWGRGKQTPAKTQGINLAVTKVAPTAPGCQLFYEIEFRFIDPAKPNLPPSDIVHVAFQDAEDLVNNSAQAVFGLPIGPPLSPGRTAALDDFIHKYLRATWRVRVTDGWSHTSGWSAPVTMGPAPGGVAG